MTSNKNFYTVLITFHGAQNVPVADLGHLSCDPYIEATIVVPAYAQDSPSDPPLRWRTPTVHSSRDPTWDTHWAFSAVPQSGFILEMRLLDEDRKRDDRLGLAEVHFDGGMMHEGFVVENSAYKVQKRKGSIQPWAQTYAAALFPGQKLRKHSRVTISARILGKCPNTVGRKPYTIGPSAYSKSNPICFYG